MTRRWVLDCPVCKRQYVVPFDSPWSCPKDPAHEPITVREWRPKP